MRIGMVMSLPFPAREGMGFYVWNLSRYLAEQGHTIHIITRGGVKRTQYQCVEGIHIWRPPFLPVFPLHAHLHGLFVNNLVHELENKIDVFHLHTPLVNRLKTKRPTLVTVHTPMKADVGSIPVNNLLGLLIRLQAPVSYRLEQNVFDQAQTITAVAHSVVQELADYNIPAHRVHVLGNGVDTTFFYPAAVKTLVDAPYFLTVGRLAPRKGIHDLLRCAQIVTGIFPEYQFLIAGDGPLRTEIERDIQQMGLTHHVKLLGHIDNRTQLLTLYRGAACYVHAAHYEGLPTALLEAMACGRPVVTTAVSGALDVIQHGANGLLTRAHAPDELAAAVMQIIKQPDRAGVMGDAAAQTIEDRYAWAVISRQYLSHYQALLPQAEHQHGVFSNA